MTQVAQEQALKAFDTSGQELMWPDDSLAADPDQARQILEDAADATGSKIIRKFVRSTQQDRLDITYFVYNPTSTDDIYDGFGLTRGRWPTRDELQAGTAVASTKPDPELEQGHRSTGTPHVFGGGLDLTFAGLVDAYSFLPATGRYVIQSTDTVTADAFFAHVQRRLVDLGVNPATLALSPSTRVGTGLSIATLPTWQFIPVLTLLACLLGIARVLTSRRHIGVYRLFGYSQFRAWRQLGLAFHSVPLLIASFLCLTMATTAFPGEWKFVAIALETLLGVSAVTALVTYATVALISTRIHVRDLSKGA